MIETGTQDALREEVYINPDANNASIIQISVLVPCYNASATLQQCLDSIRSQTEKRLDIICINDGSTDDTLAILERNAAQDKRISIIDKPNAGYGAALNDGLNAARGQWISIVEADDWIDMGMYFSMLVFFFGTREDQTGRIDIIKTPYWRIVNAGQGKERRLNCAYRKNVNPSTQPFRIAEGSELLAHHPSIWSALYRREFLEEERIRLRETPGASWADNLFLLDTLLRAGTILYLDQPFYCYREDTPGQVAEFTRTHPLLPFERWQEMLDIIEDVGGLGGAKDTIDSRILSAHYLRGFAHLDDIQNVGLLEDEAVATAVKAMFERMDADLVLSEPRLSPQEKELFLRLRGLPERDFDSREYNRHLLRKGLRSLISDGPANTLGSMRRFLGKRH
ncbi:MAG: glycosyltransferase [Coriobacteriales bacterium]|jgi:glycosyltransferase involved in cell wall biosynthesis|nr:glycosyltransferase [Coriobacteriales bacterium]